MEERRRCKTAREAILKKQKRVIASGDSCLVWSNQKKAELWILVLNCLKPLVRLILFSSHMPSLQATHL